MRQFSPNESLGQYKPLLGPTCLCSLHPFPQKCEPSQGLFQYKLSSWKASESRSPVGRGCLLSAHRLHPSSESGSGSLRCPGDTLLVFEAVAFADFLCYLGGLGELWAQGILLPQEARDIRSWFLETLKVPPFGKSMFALLDVNKSKIWRWGDEPGLSRSITSVLTRERQRGIHTPGKEGMWRQRQRLEQRNYRLRNTGSHQKLEEGQNGFPSRTSGGSEVVLSPWFRTSGLRSCENQFRCLKTSLWSSVTAARVKQCPKV